MFRRRRSKRLRRTGRRLRARRLSRRVRRGGSYI